MFYNNELRKAGGKMKHYKSYKFRIYPSVEQKLLINKTFGCTRFVYNYYLAKKKIVYSNRKENLSCYDMCKDLPNLNKEYEFLKEVDSMSLRCSLFDLDDAYKSFYNKIHDYPKFKGKFTSKMSYRTNLITSTYKGREYQNIKVDLINNVITLPKLKEIKIRGYRNLKQLPGRIINATISKEKDFRYYVSILVEEMKEIFYQNPKSIIGIDLGIKDLVITSDGKKFINNKVIEKYEKRIKRLQRRLSKKVKGSSNYQKTKILIATLYRKIRNTRKYYLHSISKELVTNNDIIVSENLNIKSMTDKKNHTLSKLIADASWYELTRQIEYKSKLVGKKYIKVDTYYASSQICSVCGSKFKKVKDLNIRKWECPKCGANHDRDINASINIMFEGVKQYIQNLI